MKKLFSRKYLIILSCAIICMGSGGVLGQNGFPEPDIKLGEEYPLVETLGTYISEETVVIMTGVEPFIHVFEENNWNSFGRKGNGPGEFENASYLEVYNGKIFALDFRIGAFKVIQYDEEGNLVGEYPLRKAGISMCYDFKISGGDKILEVGQWGEVQKDVVLLNETSNTLDTLISYREPSPKKIDVPEGPMQSWTFTNPYQSSPRWTVDNDGNMFFWDGTAEFIEKINMHTMESERLQIPSSEILIEQADVKYFLDQKYALNAEPLFGHENPYKFLRKRIEDEVNAKGIKYFPLLSAIKVDSKGLWLLRARKAEGQIWSYVSSKYIKNIQFPENETLLSVQKEYLVLKSTSHENKELLKFYSKEEVLK